MISTRSSINSKVKQTVFAAALLAASFLSSAHGADSPVSLQALPNPNDYALFANGGYDGNWFVGSRSAWVKKIPPVPPGSYARAYIGVKLGRAKTLPPVGRPPVFHPIPGDIWVAIANQTVWPVSQRFLLTSSQAIPVDPGSEYPMDNVGESQWFWVEIPVSAVNLQGDNFIAVWSPSPAFVSVSSAPILAAGWGGSNTEAWLVEHLNGQPPQDPEIPKARSLIRLEPAIALKLIPSGSAHPMTIRVLGWQNGTPEHPKPVLTVSVEGESVERVWVERNDPIRRGDVIRGNWVMVGRPLWKSPHVFTIDQTQLPKGRVLLRVSAANIWEENVSTPPFEIEVGERREK